MAKLPREKIMALVDGQLDPSEALEVVEALRHDPTAVKDLQVFLSTSQHRIAPPYTDLAREPVPQHLIDLVRYAPIGQGPVASTAFTRNIAVALRRFKERYRSMPGWSLAAGPALAGAAVAAFAWLLMPTSSVGALLATSLDVALERTASGSAAPLVSVRPLLSFKNKEAALCRQYDLLYANSQISHAVACRTHMGGWRVAIATDPEPISDKPMLAGSKSRQKVDAFVEQHSAEIISGAREPEVLGAASSPVR